MQAVFKAHGREFPTRRKAQLYEEAMEGARALESQIDFGEIGLAEAIEQRAEEFADVARLFLAAWSPIRPRAQKTRPAEGEAA